MDGVPARLGRYELLARLATGGMGEVFLARLEGAAGFEKLYAIKRVLPHLATDERFRKMMIAEAQIASRMAHSNICQVYELGESNGQLFLVMEYLEGITLHSLLRKASREGTPLDVGFVASVIGQVCDALHYAHELRGGDRQPLGLVHRDVTPANVFVCESGVVKVLDFGIAKLKNTSVTQTESVKGKFAYMAPEQLKGKPLTRRVDVFALGVVTFEVLALRRLFQRKTDYLTFQAVMEQPITDLRRYRPDLPEPLVVAIERALERNAVERWDTLRDFRIAAFADIKPWSQDEVGALVRTRFAGEIERTQAGVTNVTRTGPSPEALSTPLVAPEPLDEDDDDFPAVETDPQPLVPEVRTPPKPPVRTPSRLPRILGAILALGVVIAGTATIVMLWQRGSRVEEPKKIDIYTADVPTPELDATTKKYEAEFGQCLRRHGSALDSISASMDVTLDGKATNIVLVPAGAETSPLGRCFIGVYTSIAFPSASAPRRFTQVITLPKGLPKKQRGKR